MRKRAQKKSHKYFLLLAYVIIFNIMVIISTVVIHEVGHLFLGISYDCKNIKIVLYDNQNSSVYTQMSCGSVDNLPVLALGGFLFTIPFALAFLIFKARPEKYFSLISLGFNLTISTADVIFIDSMFLPILLTLIGGFILVISENLLINKFIQLYIKGV